MAFSEDDLFRLPKSEGRVERLRFALENCNNGVNAESGRHLSGATMEMDPQSDFKKALPQMVRKNRRGPDARLHVRAGRR